MRSFVTFITTTTHYHDDDRLDGPQHAWDKKTRDSKNMSGKSSEKQLEMLSVFGKDG